MGAGLSGNLVNIFFPVETTSRELTYKVILAARLVKNQNICCYVGSKSQIKKLIKFSENFIYIDKGYHKNISEPLFNEIKKRNGIIISLDEEGALDYSENNILKSRYPKIIFNYCEKVFLWGRFQKGKIKYVSSNKIITGNPRFDLLKKDYINIYSKEINEIKSQYGDFILINTNMGFGNNIRGEKFVIKNYGDRLKDIKKIISNDYLKMEEILQLVKIIANKKINIVIRPHPEESISIYQENFKDFSNVNIDKRFSVIPWLVSANRMIHFDCTTGIESIMIGKKSISFIPKKLDPRFLANLPISLSEVLDDISKIFYFLNKDLKINKKDKELLNTHFNFDKNSFEIIENELKKP